MIDVDNIWTSESAVENLNAVASEFYNVMCNTETLPIEAIKKLDDKHDFAYNCKCGNRHTAHGRVWSIVASTINKNTPAEGHPEREEYAVRRKEFMAEVKHIDVRDYAEPFLKQTDEWHYVEAALRDQQKNIEEFLHKLCFSKVTMDSHADLNVLVSYYCEKHGTDHYTTPQQNNRFRSRIGGAHVPEEYVPFLSKLSQRIVLRDMSAVFRDFAEQNPQTKVENPAFLKRQEEKAKRKAANIEAQLAQVSVKKTKKQNREAAKARIAEKRKNKQDSQKATYDNPNLYILKPSLMSQDWLIEYHICGRKKSYEKVSEALIFKHTETSGEYEVYECPYCSGWHLGHKSKKDVLTKAHQAKRGLFWYRRNHRKANAFIHKIMMEDF